MICCSENIANGREKKRVFSRAFQDASLENIAPHVSFPSFFCPRAHENVFFAGPTGKTISSWRLLLLANTQNHRSKESFETSCRKHRKRTRKHKKILCSRAFQDTRFQNIAPYFSFPSFFLSSRARKHLFLKVLNNHPGAI